MDSGDDSLLLSGVEGRVPVVATEERHTWPGDNNNAAWNGQLPIMGESGHGYHGFWAGLS